MGDCVRRLRGKKPTLPVGAVVVYCSPGGMTQRVAEVIGKGLRALQVEVSLFPACRNEDLETALQAFEDLSRRPCLLFVGSPVYGFHPVPPILNFIRRLPEAEKVYAVPFVTWGGVCSGSALYEMGEALREKGALLAGAVKVPSRHSMAWGFSRSLCEGRPNEEDVRRVKEGVRVIYERVVSGDAEPLSPDQISFYKGDEVVGMMEGGFEKAKKRFPEIRIDPSSCTLCGLCGQVCPLGCILLAPYPEIEEECIRCYNCVRACPEHAIFADFSESEKIVEEKCSRFGEPLVTVVYP